jgi:uroporphyrin-III C-methyltransferase/precorrin-2 dehydrogenase/sirohydrochlorin ferrochelatase
VANAAEARRVFVNAVDDPANATAFLSGVVRRDGVTVAISTSGNAPGLTSLLREALDAMLPSDLARWMREAREQRAAWRREDVPMADRKPLLLEALNGLYEGALRARRPGLAPADRPDENPPLADLADTPAGHVSIVGAGPGDPVLLTRAAESRLRAADLVLYDALVDDRVLELADRAQRFFVGKRAGRHTLTQQDIHAVMVAAARRGRRVVRLKGGDPFVFGRGGEEAMALEAAGVAYDIVPGVSSAVAAPALAGIPVTHRGVASTLVVVSGHDLAAFDAVVGRLGPGGVTLVVLMGAARRAELAGRLLAHGWAPAERAAIVADASLPGQRTWRGSVGELASGQVAIDGEGPATIIVGEVAGLDLAGGASAAGMTDSGRPERAARG